MYNQMIEKDSQSRTLIKAGQKAFMSMTAELWQANPIALVSAFLAMEVPCAEVKYGSL